MINPKTLSKIKKALKRQPIRLAYLYGSAARNQEHKNSDIDIAVVIEPKAKKGFLQIGTELDRLIPGIEIDVRELKKDSSPVFAMNVINEAKPLLVKDEKQRINFEIDLMDRYYDSEKIRRINYFYTKKFLKK